MKSHERPTLNWEVMRPGDWFEMDYGFSRLKFYVTRNDPLKQRLWFNNPKWLVSSEHSMSYAELRGDELKLLRECGVSDPFEKRPVYLGRTKRRWWWRFSPFRDLTCPFCPWRQF